MSFIVDKEDLKPGLIIFRRSDVAHRNWYCRVKLPKEDRYKTYSLKTPDLTAARQMAWEQEVRVRTMLETGYSVFNRPFRDIAEEYHKLQELRAKRGEISKERPKKVKNVIKGPLDAYIGPIQIDKVGHDRWDSYPAWRRENGVGRNAKNGTREPTDAEKEIAAAEGKTAGPVARVADLTIRFEMSIFDAVMNYAISKRYIPANHRFEAKPKLKVTRRDEFTREEYKHLYETGRKWIKEATKPSSTWYRTVAHNFVLIMCNTGMRPSEAKNLRWRDIKPAQDREGRDIFVLFVQGKDKSRNLIAPASVGKYLDRIRKISKATGPDDRVFTTTTGDPAPTLYQALIESLLLKAGLRDGPSGIPRSTYCFRHTYATFRLSEGIDVYLLAEQMGTSVKMIEEHYGHVNTVKHADRVLHGMGGWDPDTSDADGSESDKKAAGSAAARQRQKPARSSKRGA